jgi:hypothetical protein
VLVPEVQAATSMTETISAECALGKKPGYDGVHTMCRQTEDVPLPHSTGILLQSRCTCTCHRAESGQ